MVLPFHKPVLLKESIEKLYIKKNGIYVDCTFGSGGHSKEIISKLNSTGKVISFDHDQISLNYLSDLNKLDNFCFIKDNFSNLKIHLKELEINKIDGLIFDLGLSSMQIDSDRGFSYRKENSFIDMRMDETKNLTAYNLINDYSEEELSDIFFHFGEERSSKKIARSICKYRVKNSIRIVKDLVEIITSSLHFKKKKKIHPARKIFQALRIKINNELENLNNALSSAIDLLSDDSSIVIISYHSLEDRLVKKFFKRISEEQVNLFSFSKKPITPNEGEIRDNNKARSAKMRFLIKRKIKS
ncbi:MAG TPA: 16S rRNA (cytosine(1402)-N(4))-methyltransferase RsmH [Mycoplasmatales bacterium]|jgi:16S rRNA (cytosine1402-N4)-methyltransferase|nr:16S rRNA (cytosine(1402)-N(4))-methyltransferase RsmH [Mycoplasmatales bacterium]